MMVMMVKHSRAVVVIFLFLLSGSVQSLLAANDVPRGRRLAIVVGVNTYRANHGLLNLKQATNDARDLSQALREQGFKVVEMTHDVAKVSGNENLAPNVDFIRDQISGLIDTPNLGRDDTIWITLHGHGVQFDWHETVEKNGKPLTNVRPKFFFCPADASLFDAKGENIRKANDLTDRNHLLALEEIYEQLDLCKAATKLLIVDACRNDPSSPLFRSAEGENVKSLSMPKLPEPPNKIAALFSCQANQRAVDDPELNHGVFTHFLIQGIQGKADLPLENQPADGIVTLSELTTYVGNNTYSYVFDKYKGLKQSPDLKGQFDTNTPLFKIEPSQAKTIVSKTTAMKLILIPQGEFEMGSSLSKPELLRKFAKWGAKEENFDGEHPMHRVQHSRPFYLGQYEVTVGQFRKFANDSGYQTEAESDGQGGLGWDESKSEFKQDPKYSWKNTGFPQTDDHPVVNVSWNDAKKFCEWLSRKDGQQYSLPTEAQWEYACKGGTKTLWSNGNDPERLAAIGNVGDGTLKAKFPNFNTIDAKDGYVFTAPVGKFAANPFGLHDMHGNVFEWCEDVYDEALYAQRSGVTVDPKQSSGSQYRVLRGGSWYDAPHLTRSANRYRNSPDFRIINIGFRISRTP